MGNFLQARLVQADGRAVQGAVVVQSDMDTAEVFPDADGELRLETGARRWIRFVSGQGQYLLHKPPESGSLGECRVGPLRAVEGWIRATGHVELAGVGVATLQGGVFRFDAVPPGIWKLQTDGAWVVVQSLGGDAALPPLVGHDSLLQAVSTGSSQCDEACRSFYAGKADLLGDSALAWPEVCRPWNDSSEFSWNDSIPYGAMCDARDGRAYRTVTIGTQTWMAQNLDFAGTRDAEVGSCAGGDPLECQRFGRFYDWRTAAGLARTFSPSNDPAFPDSLRRGICPAGWRLPTLSDWVVLIRRADVQDDSDWNAGLPWVDSDSGFRNIFWYLKSGQGWTSRAITRAGDHHGFRALPAGYLTSKGEWKMAGSQAMFSTMTQSGKSVRVVIVAPGVTEPGAMGTDIGYPLSVRCLRE